MRIYIEAVSLLDMMMQDFSVRTEKKNHQAAEFNSYIKEYNHSWRH